MRNDSDHYAALEQAWEMYMAGDLTGALASAEATLEADSGSAEAHNLVGTILAAMGQTARALEHYDAAIAADDMFFEALLNAGDVLIQLGRTDEALRRLDGALELASGDDAVADVLLLKIDALFALGRSEDAQEMLAAMPAGPFDSPQVEFLIGRAALQLGDHSRASVLLEEAAARGIDDPDLHYYVALAREATGDLKGSTVAFLQCRERDMSAPPVPWAEAPVLFERRVGACIRELPDRITGTLEGALVLVADLPGIEMVAEGLDPRAPAMVDEIPLRDTKQMLRRLFVYQRNIDRFCGGAHLVDKELKRLLIAEVEAFLKAPVPAAPH